MHFYVRICGDYRRVTGYMAGYYLPTPDSCVLDQHTSSLFTMASLPESLAESARSPEYLRLLDADLQRLSELSRRAHTKVTSSRRTAVSEATQNVYLHGELVLVQRDPDKPLPSKLTMPFSGPYEAIDQVGNDVKCRHLATHAITEFPVSRLKIFHGSRETAKASAAAEVEQSQVRAITAWRGDPLVRTTMEFRTEFMDGDVIWLPYSPSTSIRPRPSATTSPSYRCLGTSSSLPVPRKSSSARSVLSRSQATLLVTKFTLIFVVTVPNGMITN